MRTTFRVRLACLTGLVIVATGVGLLALNYALVRHSLGPSLGDTVEDFVVVLEPGIDMPAVPGHPPEAVEPSIEDPTAHSAGPPGQFDPATRSEEDLQAHLAGLGGEVERVTLREVVTQSSVALGVMSLVAVGVSWFMAGRFLRPVRALTHTARQLSGSTLHRRIAIQGPRDELTELADTFDDMLDRLERAFEAQRRFVANASHELRTPITISRTAVDVLDAKVAPSPEQVKATIEKVRRASERSEALIDGLLLLARTDTELTERIPVDLAEVVASVLEELEPEFQRRDLRVEAHLDPALVSGDPVLLDRLVANLVENALKYNRPGGWVELHATPTGGGGAQLVVANTGPLIDPAEAEGLFEPFRRGVADRANAETGTGLGLSIARSIARAHGGSASLAPRPEGGLQMTVQFGSPLRKLAPTDK